MRVLVSYNFMKKLTFGEWVAVVIAVVVVSYFFFFNGTIFSFSPDANPAAGLESGIIGNTATTTSTSTATMTNNSSSIPGVQITDTVVGTGTEATAGHTVVVNYTGKFADGTIFDSSIPRGTPFDFQLGAGQVIQGWDQGIVGMKEGGKRTLVISPEMAYGAAGVKNPYTGEQVIPANATLIFDVELLDVQ